MGNAKIKTKYAFLLANETYSKCPKCSHSVRQIKIPIAIKFNFGQMMFLNKHCMYCKDCDLLIVNKNEINEPASSLHGRGITDKDYEVLGTVEKSLWKLGCKGRDNTKDIILFRERVEQ
ncbi:MAG: hypothetical protein QME12_04275 [Nanoarchaeota archaeon]|nr:hypothetical protein [Nanoarchaeota archaeon]